MDTERKIKTTLFYFAYFTFLIFSMMGHIPTLGGYLKLLPNFGILLLCILSLNSIDQFDKNKFWYLAVLFLYSFLICYTAKYFALFKMLLLIIAARNVDFEKCVKYDLYARVVISIATIFLYTKGIAPDVTSYYEGHYRHSMGFENPNHLGIMAFIIIVEIIYLYKADLGILQYAIILGVMLYANATAESRTSTLMIIFLLFVISIYKAFPTIFQYNWVRLIMKFTPIICALFTFVGFYLFRIGNSVAHAINVLLSGRFSNINLHYNVLGLSLFGTDSSVVGRTNDNLYGYCVIGLGFVSFFLFLYFYTKIIDRLYEENKTLAIIFTCFAIYGLSERLWLNIDYNIMMLAFKTFLYKDVEEYKEPEIERKYRIVFSE